MYERLIPSPSLKSTFGEFNASPKRALKRSLFFHSVPLNYFLGSSSGNTTAIINN